MGSMAGLLFAADPQGPERSCRAGVGSSAGGHLVAECQETLTDGMTALDSVMQRHCRAARGHPGWLPCGGRSSGYTNGKGVVAD